MSNKPIIQGKFKKIFLLFLMVAALISIYQGYTNAQKIDGSDDFQWSPAALFIEGINPYTHFLAGNLDGKIILSQTPNYAHGLYVLLGPLATFDYAIATHVWAILGILMSFASLCLISKEAKLTPFHCLVLAFIFFCSTPFRNTIGNGQQSILALFAFSLLLINNLKLGSFYAGFAYFKYSFAPPIAIYILLSRGLKSFLIALLPCFLGYIIFIYVVDGNPYEVLIQPLIVGTGPRPGWEGVGDIMTLIKMSISQQDSFKRITLAYLLPILCCLILIAYAIRIQTTRLFSFCIVCLASLIFLSHRWYDHVFLLPLLAYALANLKLTSSKLLISLIIYNWFGMKIIRFIFESLSINFDGNFQFIIYNFLLNVVMLCCLFKINSSQIK